MSAYIEQMCFWQNFPSLSLDWNPDHLSNILALWEVEIRYESHEERAALWKWWPRWSLPLSLAQAQLFPCFQTERRAGRGDFYFPGDREIFNYLPFPAASCQWMGQRRSADGISPYPSAHWWAHHSTAVHLAQAVLIILITHHKAHAYVSSKQTGDFLKMKHQCFTIYMDLKM